MNNMDMIITLVKTVIIFEIFFSFLHRLSGKKFCFNPPEKN